MIIESDSTIEFPELALEKVANLEVVETVFDCLQYHHPEITQVNYNSVSVVFRFLPRYIEAEDNSSRLHKINCIESMNYIGKNGEYFEVINVTQKNCEILKNSKESELSLLWFTTDNNQITIDSIQHTFNIHEIICITEFHKLEIGSIKGLKLLKFNKPFYCILDHDSEVGCKGILYYGAANLPVIFIPKKDIEILETVWKVLCMELESTDSLQLEMLQMMLKRILILCARIFKNQLNFQVLDNTNIDIVRQFNFLIEKHFKEIHSVEEYAGLLNKAPKTLANLFKKLGNKTPLQFIQDRLILEAHRLLKYSDRSISDIGYELGFNDIQAFSRFFKKQEGISPIDYRLS